MSRRPAAVLALALAAAAGVPAPGLAQDVAPPRLTVTAQPNPAGTILNSVSFPDASHGFAVGARHTAFATTDGGQTWLPQRTPLPTKGDSGRVDDAPGPSGDPAEQSYDAVSFPDALHGHAVSSDGSVVATSDGGSTWRIQPTPAPSSVGVTFRNEAPTAWAFNGVFFVDADHGFVVGRPGLILATSDGGATWSFQGDPLFDNLLDVSFIDELHGEAVGRLEGKAEDGYIAISTVDGGRTWTRLRGGKPDDPVTPINFDAVTLIEPRHTVVAGNGGRIFVTFDSGRTWRSRRSGTNERLNGVAFADIRRGLVVGTIDFQGELRAQILATNDGGQSWFQRPTPEAANLSDVTFANGTTAYAVGCATAVGTCRNGAILKIDFPDLDPNVENPPASGPSTLPFVLLGAAMVVVGTGVLLSRRR